MKQRLLAYLKSNNHYWWTAGVLPGIYALLYFYEKNYSLANSWQQVIGLTLALIGIPSLIILILDQLFKRFKPQWRSGLYYIFLGLSGAIVISLVVYARWKWKGLIAVAILLIVSVPFLKKWYKIGVLLLGFMIVMAIYNFGHFYIQRIVDREPWIEDAGYEDLVFSKKPNIYLIQPDGYVNKETIENKVYSFNNDEFYESLTQLGFNFNHNYRSNYPSTLTSNSALFTSQHHYFEKGNMDNELLDARDIIMGANPVVSTLKNNGYYTAAILEHRYLMMNYPEVAYDTVNIKNSLLSVLPEYKYDADYLSDLENLLKLKRKEPQFTFIEVLKPGHINVIKEHSQGVAAEKDAYLDKLISMNDELLKIVNLINKYDAEAVVIIVADHGGFAGFEYSQQCFETLVGEPELKQSMYGSLFAIKGLENSPDHLAAIKSSVSLFPNLFNHLASKKPDITRDNSSYIYIKDDKNTGVYKYYDTQGNPVTQPYSME